MKKKLSCISYYIAYWINRYGHLLLPLSAGILSLVTTHILYAPVLNRSGDNIYHLLNEYALMNAVYSGDNVFGPVGFEMGQPVLRFYQGLFYLFNVFIQFLTRLDMKLIHNFVLCTCFALSPFSYYYFLRKLRLNKWTAAFASYSSFISVAAFGNSFEAFFQAGIVTQSMGSLFFPWFMGVFIGMLRKENSPVSAAVLFALAFLSHAIMAVFATFTGILYFLISETSIRANIKNLCIFSALGIALVAFWVFPFIYHNKTMRPVPDSVFRGSGVLWYTSLSTSELISISTKGYLFDDARASGEARNEDEKLMDRINIMHTLTHRPPIFSIAIAWGIFCSLFLLRSLAVRFLLSGFLFALMIFTGGDDFPWVSYLPLIGTIQTFRCTYLIEFFAFGLSAIGVEAIIGNIYRFSIKRKRCWTRIPSILVWLSLVVISLGWIGKEIIVLGKTHVVIRDTVELNQDLDALQNIPYKGYPFKVDPRTGGRPKIRHGWFAMHGYMPFCTHWKGTGPETSYRLCSFLNNPQNNIGIFAMSGVRWFSGWGETMDNIINLTDEDQIPTMYEIPVGQDRRGHSNTRRTTLDTGYKQFLRPYLGSPVPVVCNDKQWLALTTAWLRNYRTKLWFRNMPLIMRVEPGQLSSGDLLERAVAIFYLDHAQIKEDQNTLEAFSKAGGKIITPVAIEKIEAHVLGEKENPWSALPVEINNASPNFAIYDREEMDPGLEVAHIQMQFPKRRTYQHFAFDVEAMEPVTTVLPLELFPGWRAYLNGEEVPILATGPNLIGISIPKGVHRLKLSWKMPYFDKLTLGVLFLAIFFVLGIWIRNIIMAIRDERWVPKI